jgi:hypothetical protein
MVTVIILIVVNIIVMVTVILVIIGIMVIEVIMFIIIGMVIRVIWANMFVVIYYCCKQSMKSF